MSKKRTRKKKRDIKWLNQLTFTVGALTVVLVGIVIIFVVSYRSTGHEIELDIVQDADEVIRGVPLEISINVNNQTASVLSDAELAIRLSQGLINLDFAGEKHIIRDTLGNIGKGSLTKQTYKLLPVSEIELSETITATLSYSIGRTKFEKQYVHDITVKREALEVVIETPEQILSDSEFEFTVHYNNISDFDFSSLSLDATYPLSLTFVSSDLAPDSFHNSWKLGSLRAGSGGDLTVRAIINDSDNISQDIIVKLLADFAGQSYCVAEAVASLTTAESPIGLSVFVAGTQNNAVRIGDILTYTLSYHNRSGIALRDVTMKAEFSGELFDFNALLADVKLDTFTKTLMWDKQTTPAFKLLEPNARGVLTVAIGLKQSFPINRLNDKNFTLRLSTRIESPSVPYYLNADKITAVTNTEIKVTGQANIEAKVFYRDAASGMLNLGTLPPRVGVPTQYSVHWLVRNYATDIRDIRIGAGLPQGVQWTGIVKSNIDSVPLYEEETGSVIWDIEHIPATKGIIGVPVEAIFQVEATPTHSFIGRFQPLLTNTTLTAIDDFTGITLTSSDGVLNTALPYDPTVSTISGIVIE